MVANYFLRHGQFCASHPWEVIVATFTLTACMLAMDSKPVRNVTITDEINAADVIVMTLIRVVAVLYSYYQFTNLQKLGSKYILGITGLFTVVSSFMFSTSVINFLHGDISDLKDALFFFLLLIDLSKATTLAQLALSASNCEEVKENIARGVSLLGPTITLDTLVETLVISVGTLSGVQRLEVLCCYACLSVVVHYAVFMTFYPAVLSLILELVRCGPGSSVPWSEKSPFMKAWQIEDQKPNPVVQRVKLIMSVGLVVVHAHSRWSLHEENPQDSAEKMIAGINMSDNSNDNVASQEQFIKWFPSIDNILILILILALVAKFIFQDNNHMATEASLAAHLSLDTALINKFTPALLNGEFASSRDWREVSCRQIESRIHPNTPKKRSNLVMDNKCSQTDHTFKSGGEAVESENKMVQTLLDENVENVETPLRSVENCAEIFKNSGSASTLTDNEVCNLVVNGVIPAYQVEKAVKNPERGVGIRRRMLAMKTRRPDLFQDLPYKDYDYSKVLGACCENVVGVVPLPVGIAGPLRLDDELVYVPLATTEGCLVASTNRGSRALSQCGVKSQVVADGMTRGPVVRFPSATRASEAMGWMLESDNFDGMKKAFDSTSRFARLTKIHVRIAGRYLFVRFVATTGDAMGMNMLSKGTEHSLKFVKREFPDMEVLSLSGNFCSDKKPAAINWIEGRGKSVVCEAVVPGSVVSSVLKTTVHALVDVNVSKNLIGSAMAGSIGGFNAHAANIVTAIFIATGQDPAQNVTSSNCMTLMEPWGENGQDLYVSCTMPSIEIGTVGGGTILSPQAACLELLKVKGPNLENPGENASRLARVVCGTVLAGELSLMSALASGHLVQSHLTHNRSSASLNSSLNNQSFCETESKVRMTSSVPESMS
ncbi:3-hydroxy-3-methylglutaryl-coenzyme A reductase [Bemisia tabaci]|uniref:3-hydroxy-3-methylglutaryl-coenzyme A reductase n=1 Tax=Bemisia tabaci TaxID=7038 RepID=UPI003B280C45